MHEIAKRVGTELQHHAPFTLFGALTGIIIMVLFVYTNLLSQVITISENIFFILHPTHVVLSALVTTAMYKKYNKDRVWAVILVGYFGSIGISTLSDSIIPYLGEILLDLPNKGIHIGFIEEWWIVNPAALIGLAIGLWKPTSKLPHSGHVLISTWASLFHILMALGGMVSWITILVSLLFLFIAVWIPCCTSDIVFPLLFTRKRLSPQGI